MPDTVKLFEGDMRLENLLQALKSEVYKRCEGLPVPAIIGVIEILKLTIIREQED